MTEEKLEFDESLLGKEVDAGSFDVTREQILNLCRVVGETNPLFTDEAEAQRRGYKALVAPPTITNLLIRSFNRPEVKVNFGNLRLHAGQAIECLVPICAGDRLNGHTSLKDVYTKTGRTGTMAFIVWETRFTNQDDIDVARVRESFMVRK